MPLLLTFGSLCVGYLARDVIIGLGTPFGVLRYMFYLKIYFRYKRSTFISALKVSAGEEHFERAMVQCQTIACVNVSYGPRRQTIHGSLKWD